jgi:hypothetical protein
MGLFDFFKPSAAKPVASPHAAAAVECIYAVPVMSRSRTSTGLVARTKEIYFAFVFARSDDDAVARLRKELRDQGSELLELTGPVEAVPLTEWADFVGKRLHWLRDDLPSATQLAEAPRGLIYYSPKITQY